MRRLVTAGLLAVLALTLVPQTAPALPTISAPDASLLKFISSRPAGTLVPLIVSQSGRPWFVSNSAAHPRQIGNLPYWTVNVSTAIATAAVASLADSSVIPNRSHARPKPAAVENSGVASDPVKITGADLIQAAGNRGAGEAIAVIDTGIQGDHAAFSDGAGGTRVLPQQACFVFDPATAEFPCLTNTASDMSLGSAEIGSDPFLAANGYEHGTHVASIIAGRKPVSPAWVVGGMAPDANIVAVRVFGHVEGGYDSDILAGLSWVDANAALLKISAVNLSLGGVPTDAATCLAQNAPYETAFASLVSHGVAPVVATGNDGNQFQIAPPACLPSAISVGSTNANDSVSIFSNVSTDTDLMAPGNLVGNAVPIDTWVQMSGTSMAAPVVAGAFALAHKTDPTLTVTQWLDKFKATGTAVSATAVSNLPRINVSNALSSYAGLQPPSSVAGTWPNFTNFNITWMKPALGPVPTGYRITDGAKTLDVAAEVLSYSGTFSAVNHVVTIASLNGPEVSAAASFTVAPQSIQVPAVTKTNSALVEIADYCTGLSPVVKLRYNSPQIAPRTVWMLTGDGRAQSIAETTVTPATSPLEFQYAKEILISQPDTWLTSSARIYYANPVGTVGNSLSLAAPYAHVIGSPLIPAVPTNLFGTGSYERATISWDAGGVTSWRVLVDGSLRGSVSTSSATLALSPGLHTVSVCAVASATNGTYFSRRANVEVTVAPKMSQTITASGPTELQLSSPNAQLEASATSLLPLTFASATPTVCSVTSSGLVTALMGGACTIAINQSGNADFAAAPTVYYALQVAKSDQTITVTGTNVVTLNNPTTVSVSASSKLPLTYFSLTPDVCSVTAEGILTGLALGRCSLEISQAGNSAFNPAVTITLNVDIKLAQSITASQPTDLIVGGSTFTIEASASSSLSVVFSTLTSAICSVDTLGVITGLAAGECRISVAQPGAGDFAAAPEVLLTLRVRSTQSIDISVADSIVMTSPRVTISAAASSTLALTFESLTSGVCSVSNSGSVLALSAGECRVRISQAGSLLFVATSRDVTIMVSRASQSINAPMPSTLLLGGTQVSLGVSATSNQPVAYSSESTEVCSVSGGGVVFALAVGACVIHFNQAGSIIYLPAEEVSVTFPVRVAQTITSSQIVGLVAGKSVDLSASSNSTLTIIFSSATPSVCSVSNLGVVTTIRAGDCAVVLTQSGDNYWANTIKDVRFAVVAARPTVVTRLAANVVAVGTSAKLRLTWLKPSNALASTPTSYVIKWRSISPRGVISAWKAVSVTKLVWISPTFARGTTINAWITAKGPAGAGPTLKVLKKL